jgi:DNA polymerase elongation subunit (family B)
MTGFKRLFFDIETSPNIVFSWNIGRDISIDYENILNERAIICICYKWENDKKIHHLTWNKGDDKKMIQEFARIIDSADEVIGHNSDRFDVKWVRTRALFHKIPFTHEIQSIDTLKAARGKFKFNSNRLDYIAKFLGLDGKIKTEYSLWKNIVLHNDKASMDKMVRYCKKDVKQLERIYHALSPYLPHKTHRGVFEGYDSCSCPECSSQKTVSVKKRISAAGVVKRQLVCRDCGRYFSVSEAQYQKNRIENI